MSAGPRGLGVDGPCGEMAFGCLMRLQKLGQQLQQSQAAAGFLAMGRL